MRALICTFGFDADKIILAMKCIKHDRLVLVTGTDNLEHDSFDRISSLCERLRTPFEVMTTDKFDMLASMRCSRIWWGGSGPRVSRSAWTSAEGCTR